MVQWSGALRGMHRFDPLQTDCLSEFVLGGVAGWCGPDWIAGWSAENFISRSFSNCGPGCTEPVIRVVDENQASCAPLTDSNPTCSPQHSKHCHPGKLSPIFYFSKPHYNTHTRAVIVLQIFSIECPKLHTHMACLCLSKLTLENSNSRQNSLASPGTSPRIITSLKASRHIAPDKNFS